MRAASDGKKNKSKAKPAWAHGRLSDFSVVRKGATTARLPSERKDAVERRLAGLRMIPSHYPEDCEKQPIQYRVTPAAEAMEFLDQYPNYWVDHVMTQYEFHSDIGRVDALYAYLANDPIGVEDVPKTDTQCWKASRSGAGEDPTVTYKKTERLVTLESYQQTIHDHMRASLELFMNDPAKQRLKNWVRHKERKIKPEDKPNRLKRGIRIPWAKFKNFVQHQLCQITRGSFHYLPLHQVMRLDNQVFLDWCETIREIAGRVRLYAQGWDAIIDKEALFVLTDWVSEKETQSLTQYLVKNKLQDKYPSLDDMATNMKVDDFIDVFRKVQPKDMPRRFTQAMQLDALNKTLVPYSRVKAKDKQIEALKKQIADLKTEKHEALRKSARVQADLNRLQKDTKPTETNQKRKPTPKPDEPKNKPKDNNEWVERPGVDEYPKVKKGKFGQCKAGNCQRCHNLGMKNRKHKGPCSSEMREKAYQRFKKNKEQSERNRDENNRKYHFSEYSITACKHCIREDASPSHADKHDEDKCYRKPGGILDQKGIKGKKARTAEVKRLAQQAFRTNQEKHGKAPKDDSKKEGTSNVSFAAVCRASVAVVPPTKRKAGTPPAERKAEAPPCKRKADAPLLPMEPDKAYDSSDVRWSAYQGEINPCRYIRSRTAVDCPLSMAEIKELLADPKFYRDRRHIQQVRYHYEFHEHEHRLIQLREQKATVHPYDYPALFPDYHKRAIPSYVPVSQYLPKTQREKDENVKQWEEDCRRVSHDAQMELSHYQREMADLEERVQGNRPDRAPTKFHQMARMCVNHLTNTYRYSTSFEAERMFHALHARWERNKQIKGDPYVNLKSVATELDWRGFKHRNALDHPPFRLVFPNENHIKDAAEIDLMITRFTRMRDHNEHYGNDGRDIDNFLIKLGTRSNQLHAKEADKAEKERQDIRRNRRLQQFREERELANKRKRTTTNKPNPTEAHNPDETNAEAPAGDTGTDEPNPTKVHKPDEPEAEGPASAPTGEPDEPDAEGPASAPTGEYTVEDSQEEEGGADDAYSVIFHPSPVKPSEESSSDGQCNCFSAYAQPHNHRTATNITSDEHESNREAIEDLFRTDSDSSDEEEVRTTDTCTSMLPSWSAHISPETVAEQRHEPPKAPQLVKDKDHYDLFTDVLGLPHETWCPATTKRNPVARTYVSVNKKSQYVHNDIYPTEQKGYRLLQADIQYRDKAGKIQTGRVQLDTYSNINYVSPDVGLPRKTRHPWEATKATGIGGKSIRLGKPRTLTIMKNDQPVVVDSVTAPPKLLGGCVALLGLDAITALGIDINHAIEHDKHMPIRFKCANHAVCDAAKRAAIDKYPKQRQLERYIHAKCYLSERVCAEYVKKHPNDYKKEAIQIGSMDIGPNVPNEHKGRLESLAMKYADVFAQTTNTLPRILRDVQPHSFKLKEGATPVRTGRPKFGKAQSKIINDWVEWALEAGLIERATTTSWSSRLILAAKHNHDTPKSALPDGIRVAWAGVEVNDRIEKTVPTYPDAWEQLYKVANFKYKFSADGLKQYWSIDLDQKSREVTAFWTPQGLFQFTRLVMGTKNAATIAQNAYTDALNTKLDKGSYDHVANFADDFLGGANTMDALVHHFEEFLKMCRASHITLNPKKVRIGYEKEQFYGLSVDNGKIEPAERNLDPIKRITTPKSRSELRSIMGMFNQFSGFIKDYGREISPASVLNALMSPKVPFTFTETHQRALDDLKQQVLQGVHLYAPDNNHQLMLDTDGSIDGWGAVLYQIIDGEKRIIKMWSKQWKTEAWQKKPTYHREAKAWMNGLTLTIPYALQNKFPVKCFTDHTPLTWIKHTSGKGPVSQFIVDTLSVIDYEMNYVKGKDNVIADALSRFPLLGPSRLQQHGTAQAVNILLSALCTSNADTRKLWFYIGKDTQHLATDVYDWRHEFTQGKQSAKQHCFMDPVSASRIQKMKYTFGIWAPPADKITQQCRAAFERNIPFACLVPSDLVHHIATDHKGIYSTKIGEQVERSLKIALLAPGLVWVIHGLTFDKSWTIRTVYANMGNQVVSETEDANTEPTEVSSERITEEFELQNLVKILKDSNLTPPLPEFSTRARWVEEQEKHRTKLLYENTKGVYEAPDGLLVYEEDPGPKSPTRLPLRTIVPDSMTIDLARWQHKNLCHAGAQKLLSVLKRRFYWKGMRKTCEHVTRQCALCNLLKARMKLAHKHFRPKLYCKPRTAYGADYYAVKQNKEGYNNILGIIDLATGFLSLNAVKARTGANTAHVVFYEIVVRKGVPQLFHSDAAKELIGQAMTALSTILGIKLTNTLAHNPKGNAKIERVWAFVGNCLQSMTPEQYNHFHKYLPIIAHVWNTVPDANTGITPFEAEHGMKCIGVAESIIMEPPSQGLPATADDLRTVAASVSAFMEALTNVKAIEKAQAAIKLNADGTSKITYNIGDRVSFYLPPDRKTVAKMNKKKKHILQYTGPAEIVESLSPNGTSFKLKYKDLHYYRNVMHLNKYTALDEVPAALQIVVDTDVSVGAYVAVLDDEEDRHYHIAQVLDIDDRNTKLHYLGTKSRTIRSAKWTKLYHHPGSNQVTFDQPENLTRNWTRFTGVVETKDPSESLIILSNVGLTDTGRINSASRRILSRKARMTHHVMNVTWNP